MEKVTITCFLRDQCGKEFAKKIRKDGFIPAIVYGQKMNLTIKVPAVSLKTLRSIHFSESTIINMVIEGYKDEKRPLPVLIREVQHNPLTEDATHIDFMKVSLEDRIKVKVPIELKGECKGVKDGGILQQQLWEAALEALPLDVPENIKIDVSGLEIGHSIHIKDLELSDNIKIMELPDETIVSVVVKHEEEEVVEELVEEGQEPEVIKEKEKEEEKEEEKEK